MDTPLQNFAQKHKQFWWWVPDVTKLSERSVIEWTLNFGQFEEKKEIINIIWPTKVKKEFHDMVVMPRSNIRPEVASYWTDYLNTHFPNA